MAIKCKRIIDGNTYNTETATQIDGSASVEGPHHRYEYLYQNRFGAFFLYRFDGQWDDKEAAQIEPFTADQARQWLEKRPKGAEYIEALFGEVPEAGSGESKFTLRIPESLRDRLAALAKDNNQSLNAWMVRCLERCGEYEMGQFDVALEDVRKIATENRNVTVTANKPTITLHGNSSDIKLEITCDQQGLFQIREDVGNRRNGGFQTSVTAQMARWSGNERPIAKGEMLALAQTWMRDIH